MISPVCPQSRVTLAKIRCLQECIQKFHAALPLPEAFCYVPGQLQYKVTKLGEKIVVYSQPVNINQHEVSGKKSRHVIGSFHSTKDTVIEGSGEEVYTSAGQWMKIKQTFLQKLFPNKTITTDGWIILFDSRTSADDPPKFHRIVPDKVTPAHEYLYGRSQKHLDRWDQVIEVKYSLTLGDPVKIQPTDDEAVKDLREVPGNWDIECDEEMVKFLSEHVVQENEKLGNVKQYVEAVAVSSSWDEESAACLTDGDPSTYWESDGRQGQHWIRLTMRKGVIVKKLYIGVDCHDDNYMPIHVIVMGGELDVMVKLNDVHIEQSFTGDYCVLEDVKKFYPYIEIQIKSCEDDGVDTRIHGIKIKSLKERELGLLKDTFCKEELVRYPRLEAFNQDQLYHRALVLLRFSKLLDSVIHFIVPVWEYSLGSFRSCLDMVRQFLPLSKKRISLIQHFLTQSEAGKPDHLPKLFINRRAASEHRQEPNKDPTGKNTIFTQVYDGLQPKEKYAKQLDFRWPKQFDQWWECKFLSEGIIDQGGGFRDSLADMAEELCPTEGDVLIPLPFFVRSPNQSNRDTNVNRDVYVPNPLCQQFVKFEWIGQLMGGCLRGKEHLVLSLPPFIWKQLVGEKVTWTRDFISVDATAVKLVNNLRVVDEETFQANFAGQLTYVTALSGDSLVELVETGATVEVNFDERIEYCKMVETTRMSESKKQIEALRKGLLKVVPQAVLDLLTWQELETKICGDPDVSVEALLKTTILEDLEQSSTRVKMFWEALGNFTNEDRSRFLRFVTGRRRLPTPLYICADKEGKTDILPESSTCTNTLFLPSYSDVKIAEEKLRYAAYNCVAIDADMSPWDE
ncbi:putative E3 ubiquitin-protein ligase HECTD3 [Apostichopus japonicus]|uniref:Putative E3 ubiquitin-protein ligase HECTD3 n=1 Tax=Stichopus japonicus TaxID=307972 RepID=A0A2G8K2R6_STIJA|nr:putative E3 ubiquitin-protein ligase HECTD3 [Apostichopus japonicus]